MRTQQCEDTIIRLESMVEKTPSGRLRTIYRKKVFRPSDADYEKEKELRDKFSEKNSLYLKPSIITYSPRKS
jgi:hypothetical protein